jgi:hypothetical protein
LVADEASGYCHERMRRSLLGVLVLVVVGQSPVLAQDRSRPASAPDFIGIFSAARFPESAPRI